MMRPPTVWMPMGIRPSPLPCDPLALGAATSPPADHLTSGSEGLMGSVLKSTSKAAKVAGEKQQRAAIASATKPKRLRNEDVTTAKPLSNLRAYRPMLRDGEPRAFSLSLEPYPVPSGQQKALRPRLLSATFLRVIPSVREYRR